MAVVCRKNKVPSCMVSIEKSRGFNLIELLVALVVVAVALFAVAKIQILGLQSGESAKQSTASTVNVLNLLERLDAHRVGIGNMLDGSDDGISYFMSSADTKNGDSCNEFPIGFDDTDGSGVACEIDAWVYSVKNSLNLVNDEDICANVFIETVPNFNYKLGMKYRIPKVTVEYKWRKTPSSSADINCNLVDNRLPPPKYDSNPSNDQTAEIGYSTMEYLLP